ncbi:hypothetical protein A3I18_01675 [Candidatus Campbellbacteria bacterium RIFCSPLOWO2_02_FULL_35_11]|uniref:Uncharacterized protein n=2 Tax=Candidatus Campbelliibacteriota TaxID=1752727 RepID=A0A1F5EMD3_9BACT|nr:MAG: hypothetical protein A3E89_02855 [Candidatus Campbellbacteria bacterium RIFCSPHIGHO2_12_FULL_35_10]OGD70094.1 MAG: hypothetical protein A3I18_01675 [Candidatus Campbellbacteria bacterium RIFCSPLOWO2_02_FULL_35_11]
MQFITPVLSFTSEVLFSSCVGMILAALCLLTVGFGGEIYQIFMERENGCLCGRLLFPKRWPFFVLYMAFPVWVTAHLIRSIWFV